MRPDPTGAGGRCAVFVDLGTTNTRVWLAAGDQILARAQARVGVRDTAQAGSAELLRQTLRSLIHSVATGATAPAQRPVCVIAAGMITSSLGLAEVPHVPAPAGLKDLAAATRRHEFPGVTDLPVLLVPGVRSGPRDATQGDISRTDLMRGEETLCVGLLSLGLVPKPAVVLNLGSHWKAIRIDAGGRVAGSVTSLSGEMVHAAQTHTILASAVPPDRPTVLDEHWVRAGMREQRHSGLGRALFCVRLLSLGDRGGTPAERLAFLVGAFIAADLDALLADGAVGPDRPVALAGSAALTGAWRSALAEASVPATVLTEDQIERGLLAGLGGILAATLMPSG